MFADNLAYMFRDAAKPVDILAIQDECNEFLSLAGSRTDPGHDNLAKIKDQVVGDYAEIVKERERRFIYATPKSFLELIKLFKTMLSSKRQVLSGCMAQQSTSSARTA